jgi:hypothetical protein
VVVAACAVMLILGAVALAVVVCVYLAPFWLARLRGVKHRDFLLFLNVALGWNGNNLGYLPALSRPVLRVCLESYRTSARRPFFLSEGQRF